MRFVIIIILFALLSSCSDQPPTERLSPNTAEMMIRIAEIDVDSNYLKDYVAILQEEAVASVRLEPGVLCIYPMFEREQPTQIRLLEIYANRAAYKTHLRTPHFLHYKNTTLSMVKSIELIDMKAIDPISMASIFAKLAK